MLAAIVAGIYQLLSARAARQTEVPTSPVAPITITPSPTDNAEPPPPPIAATVAPDDPATRVLTIVTPDNGYEGLDAHNLDAQFLTDVQFTLKVEDKFEFDDDTGDK